MRTLSQEYLYKAKSRRKAVQTLFDDGNYADVFRESQELIELLLKGLLRDVGIDPPKWHDVGQILLTHTGTLPQTIQDNLQRLTALSKSLRKERELSFYGDEDFIPSESYTREQATEMLEEVDWAIALVEPELKT